MRDYNKQHEAFHLDAILVPYNGLPPEIAKNIFSNILDAQIFCLIFMLMKHCPEIVYSYKAAFGIISV